MSLTRWLKCPTCGGKAVAYRDSELTHLLTIPHHVRRDRELPMCPGVLVEVEAPEWWAGVPGADSLKTTDENDR